MAASIQTGCQALDAALGNGMGAVWARSGCRGPCAIPGAPAEKGLRPGVAVGTVVFIT